MTHLPTIISDLSMILLVAGITTILFKKLHQPLVLGYIIAGFITGPNCQLFPTVMDSANISTWSEIGVIFLMFALGLEFSFYKLKSVGSTAFIASAVAIGGMIVVGYFCGNLLGWSHMNSLFLGGMLSMSSTAIIIKAFDDMKLKEERFAQLVLGMLIIEDIAGIVMLVILSTLGAASSGISTEALFAGVGKLVFCIILWFVLGMYLIPTFFKKTKSIMNDETLVVASIGLCLGMVVLASHMGFSSALGAFIMGSLIAEAPNADRIEHLVKPVKDLFGAVFFVSVGMLVNPSVLVEYAAPIAILVVVTIVGQVTMSTIGFLSAGQDLHTAVRCGCSLCQIGEFSFIIASLGTSLNVTSDFLYPIIVAVSVITTFTTPFLVMSSEGVYNTLNKILPKKLLTWLERYTEKEEKVSDEGDWKKLINSYIIRMAIYFTLLTAILVGAKYHLLPYLEGLGLKSSEYITGAATLVVMSPILRAVLVNRAGNAELFGALWFKRRSNHLPLLLLIAGKFVLAGGFLHAIFSDIMGFHRVLCFVAMAAAAYFISSSDWLMGEYLRIESRFLVNMNEKHMRKHYEAMNGEAADSKISWFDQDLQLARYTVKDDSKLIGKNMIEMAFRQHFGCNILQITKGDHSVDMPGGKQVLERGSSILVIGTKEQLNSLQAGIGHFKLGIERVKEAVSLRQFMLEQTDSDKNAADNFLSCAITIDKHTGLLGQTIKAADLRNRWHCLVIGLERGDYTFTNPNVSLVFEKGDLLWVLGKQEMINILIREEIL